MERQQEYVLRTIEDKGVRFVRLWFTDVVGQLKSVAIAPAELEEAFEEGIGFDGSSIQGMTRVYEDDMTVRPDAETFSILPWRGEDLDRFSDAPSTRPRIWVSPVSSTPKSSSTSSTRKTIRTKSPYPSTTRLTSIT